MLNTAYAQTFSFYYWFASGADWIVFLSFQMFKMSKVVAEKNAADTKGVESSLPLQTTVAD